MSMPNIYICTRGIEMQRRDQTLQPTYYFDVSARSVSVHNPPPLQGALERFASLFTTPSFSELALDSEIKAIDSEYENNRRKDGPRLVYLERSLSNPNHPYQKFSTGNIESLKSWPSKNGIDVRASIMDLYSKHYSANRMKLVVIGREQLNVLQEWVAMFFSSIPNKNLTPQRWEDEAPLQEDELGTRILVNPIMDMRILRLVFPFLDQELLFDSQPGKYVSHLISHKSPGSIMAFTKYKNWVDQVGTFFRRISPGTGDMFECQFHLTEEGLSNYKEVLKVFFQYVSLLKEAPPQKWIFEELQTMADINFDHQERVSEIDFTRETSMRMQKPLPRNRLLSGDARLSSFEPALITKALACLRPDNFRLTIVSQTFRADCNQKEKWYGIEHCVEKFPDDLMDELKAAASCTASERPSSLYLPGGNKYIPSNLMVKRSKATNLTRGPKKIIDNPSTQIWFHDHTPPSPKAIVYTSFQSPDIRPSAGDVLKTTVLTFLLYDAFETECYEATLAGLWYQISSEGRVIYLRIGGYNDKLPELLEKLLTIIQSFKVLKTRYDNIFNRIKRYYSNLEFHEPYKQVSSYMACLHSEHAFTTDDLSAELPTITLEGVEKFKNNFLPTAYIESYYNGNLSESDVRRMVHMKTAILPNRSSGDMKPAIRSLRIPPGTNYIFKKFLGGLKNVDNCIEYCLYTGERDDLVRTKTMLLNQLSCESAFHQLRTVENLGYVVHSEVKHFRTTYGFSLTIQSQQSPQDLEFRIENFLNSFSNRLLSMSQEDFEAHKRSLIDKLAEKPKNLAEESMKHWAQISDGNYDFEQDLGDAARLQNLTKSDMTDFFKKYIIPGSNTRAKVSVHLVSPSSPLVPEITIEGGCRKPTYFQTINEFRAAIQGGADFKG
ncbi:hypothetical protein LZ32DRAFT_109256 [Colletotrichum eremochloae]|nr:hypothetical protein LZ32DRAFT_109256 [Colletotrichum eremochloae]